MHDFSVWGKIALGTQLSGVFCSILYAAFWIAIKLYLGSLIKDRTTSLIAIVSCYNKPRKKCRHIAKKQFRLWRLMLLFRGLSVCIVHNWQNILTQFLLHTTAPWPSQIVLKFGLYWSTPQSPNFAPKWPPPVDLSVGDIQWQIATKWLDIVQCSQWRAYRKPPSNDTVPRCRCLPNYLF